MNTNQVFWLLGYFWRHWKLDSIWRLLNNWFWYEKSGKTLSFSMLSDRRPRVKWSMDIQFNPYQSTSPLVCCVKKLSRQADAAAYEQRTTQSVDLPFVHRCTYVYGVQIVIQHWASLFIWKISFHTHLKITNEMKKTYRQKPIHVIKRPMSHNFEPCQFCWNISKSKKISGSPLKR